MHTLERVPARQVQGLLKAQLIDCYFSRFINHIVSWHCEAVLTLGAFWMAVSTIVCMFSGLVNASFLLFPTVC